MVPFQNFASGVLAAVIRRQPDSRARTSFAWQVAVGPALARSTTVELRHRVLVVRPRDARWTPELVRAADTVLRRLQHLLGPDSVQRIEILQD